MTNCHSTPPFWVKGFWIWERGNVAILVTLYEFRLSVSGTWKRCFCCNGEIKFMFFKQAIVFDRQTLLIVYVYSVETFIIANFRTQKVTRKLALYARQRASGLLVPQYVSRSPGRLYHRSIPPAWTPYCHWILHIRRKKIPACYNTKHIFHILTLKVQIRAVSAKLRRCHVS
jgi:hypothetical protein